MGIYLTHNNRLLTETIDIGNMDKNIDNESDWKLAELKYKMFSEKG